MKLDIINCLKRFAERLTIYFIDVLLHEQAQEQVQIIYYW